jgi:hypothetical protein
MGGTLGTDIPRGMSPQNEKRGRPEPSSGVFCRKRLGLVFSCGRSEGIILPVVALTRREGPGPLDAGLASGFRTGKPAFRKEVVF